MVGALCRGGASAAGLLLLLARERGVATRGAARASFGDCGLLRYAGRGRPGTFPEAEMRRRLLVEVLGTIRQGAFTPALPGLGVLLGPAPILFGSAPRADETYCPVPLRHPSVSRRHARAALEGDDWTIRDLGSDNGLALFAEDM